MRTLWHISPALQHTGFSCGGVHVVLEDVPADEDQVVEVGEGNEILDLRRETFGSLAQADSAHLRQRANGLETPPLVDERLFRAAQEQLEENRTRARLGRRRLGHLLQGLTCCPICRYAYYGKTTRERGPGHCLKDYRYYRCSGSDRYRFGAERICSNGQIRAEFLEDAVWREVCDLLGNPEKLEREFKEGGEAVASVQNAEVLKVRGLKRQHALERLIDSFTEGLIEKDQFTSRMAKARELKRKPVPTHIPTSKKRAAK